MPNRNHAAPQAADIVAIGASAGGIPALQQIIAGLPRDYAGSLLVAQHLSPNSPGTLPELLDRAGQLSAEPGQDGQAIAPGHIYVAPPDHHMLVDHRQRLCLSRGPKENRFRPAIDPLFRAVALAFRSRVAGMILTGGMDDGTAGLAAVKRAGGVAIVQDPLEADAPSMPRSALRNVAVDHRVRIREIPDLLVRLARGEGRGAEPARTVAMPKALETEVRIAADETTRQPDITRLGEPSIFSCPECHGTLLRLKEDKLLRFRCHTGHAHTAVSLASALDEGIEQDLWATIRAMEESAMLFQHTLQHLGGEDRAEAAELKAKAEQSLERAKLVRQVLASLRPAQ